MKTSHREEYLSVKVSQKVLTLQSFFSWIGFSVYTLLAKQEAILLDLLRVISHHRARLATPIRTIRKMHTAADMENAPFGESMYGPGGVASRRSSVVIEPSYKIYGEDKSKSQRSASDTTNKVLDERGVKPGAKPVSKPAGTAKDEAEVSGGAEKPKTKRSGSKTKAPKKDTTDGSTSSVSRSAIEENLVLGVALEGSKRTLPIDEEEMPFSPKEADTKELTGSTRRSGKGTLVADKEKKDAQSHTVASTEWKLF